MLETKIKLIFFSGMFSEVSSGDNAMSMANLYT